jgi:hypothetical protein
VADALNSGIAGQRLVAAGQRSWDRSRSNGHCRNRCKLLVCLHLALDLKSGAPCGTEVVSMKFAATMMVVSRITRATSFLKVS